MGGVDWENVKAKVKKGVEEIAFDLVHLYAKRKISKGFNFLPDSAWQFELEDSFEFIETPDQMRAIEETKAKISQSMTSNNGLGAIVTVPRVTATTVTSSVFNIFC